MKRRRDRAVHRRAKWRSRAPWLAIAVLGIAVGIAGWLMSGPRQPSVPLSPPPRATPVRYSDDELTASVDAFLAAIAPGTPAYGALPPFAQQRIAWAFNEVRGARLRVVLLGDLANSNLTTNDLMASGVVEGQRSIVIVRPRFVELVNEGPGLNGPFTAEQLNDFALGLVHEVVHLQNPAFRSRSRVSHDEAIAEEVRAWREVNMNVVRLLRERHQPMHAVFLTVDDAFRACEDRPDCRPSIIVGP